ncbi:MAG: CPBP family intramembrane metalloprotease [Clostridia bacterium]|nr:CPBP family intramembrane metalloprotease [Clostridia bacterium]
MEGITVKKKGISIIGAFGLVFLIALIEIALYLPLQIINRAIGHVGFSQMSSYIGVIGEVLINLLIVYWIVKRIRRKQEFNLKFEYKPKIKEYLFSVLFLFAYLFIFSNSVGMLIEKIEVSQWVVEAFDEMLMNPFVAFVSICIIAPVFEEIIYRGIILEQLSKRYSITTSIIVSGLIFGLIHFNLHQSVNAFFIGLILGFIYIKTNSLLLCMFWHFANNFLVFMSSMYVSDTVRGGVPGFSIVQFVFGIILFIASYKFFNKKDLIQNQ